MPHSGQQARREQPGGLQQAAYAHPQGPGVRPRCRPHPGTGVEEGAQVARAVRLALVFVQAGGIGENMVREVVVLVNKEVDSSIGLASLLVEVVQLFHATVLPVHLLLDALWQILRIDIAEVVELRVTDSVHRTAVIAQVGIDDGKVEVDDEILVVVWRRVLPDVEVAVEPLELVGCVDVVVMVQHRQGEALAETARTDEEEVLVGFFHFLDEPGLVDVVAVFLAYCLEVHHAVGSALCLYFCSHFFHSRVRRWSYKSGGYGMVSLLIPTFCCILVPIVPKYHL